MLDEDEVVSRMNRMVRAATQQFDSAKSIMNTVVNDKVLFDSCCEEAQNQAVIDDLLKDIFGALTTLDRHAVSWIKRTVGASGRRQKSKHGLLLANTKRRLTRGMAKTSVATKNEDILYNSVREIEREKNIASRRREWRLSSSSYNADDEGDRSKANRLKRRTNGEQSNASSNKRIRHEEQSTRTSRPVGEPILDLAALELSKQKILGKRNTATRNGSFEAYVKRSKKWVPSQYIQMGLMHSLPGWNEMQNYVHKINNLGIEVLLKEQMKGPLTRFLVCEYFYSDLDKAWFQSEEVTVTQRDPEGLPKTTYWEASKMWKQKRRGKGRRFSPRFIHGEIIERNKYRQAVRFFQQHGELLDSVPFPYDVAKRIPIGTAIAAWNNARQIICRGMVVNHNTEHSTYSVDFGEDDANQEVPDSHVATLGGPEQSRSAALSKDSSLSLLDDTKTKAQLLKELRSLVRFDPSRRSLLPRKHTLHRSIDKENVTHVKDQVAEREALVCLADSVDKLLHKKTLLLESLEEYNDDVQDSSDERYLWLRDSCKKVDVCLNTLLRYVDTFYGTAFLPNQRAGESPPIASRDGFKGALDRLPHLLVVDCCKDTGDIFTELSMLTADHLLSEVHPTLRPSQMRSDDHKDADCEDALSKVGRILLSSSFAVSGIISKSATVATCASVNNSSNDQEQETYPYGDDDDDFLASTYLARREALSELTEAAALFHAEVALSAL
ncbi:hypothetical protein FisN_4Lh562 [Fistulifera solaris]|uniref:DIRP domain-containing protein n=1 Tax=Fistulifera solaris TaxID=1519565 RepID=A0A1Z5KDY5_FISSO|nr:hypothetical protein FisN_4Lh562 [Fistulifera solaris]|eukprot:GAX24427.1 hypothetical protein FisN_4Lh562 [Fistulifera solaris]